MDYKEIKKFKVVLVQYMPYLEVDLATNLSEDEAIQMCEEKDYIYVDKNGIDWDMEIEEEE